MRLSPVVLALLPGLAASSAYAAVYQVQELPEVNTVRSQYGAALNDNGDVVGSATYIYNFPVDISSIDFENATITASLTAEEIAQAKLGNINGKIQNVLVNYLSNNNGDFTVQRYSDVQAFNLSTATQIKLREQATVPTNREYIYDINTSGNAIGVATTTFTKQSFTPAATEATPSPVAVDLWVPELAHIKSYVVSGNSVTALPIPYEENGGGFAFARKISETNYIAGSGSALMVAATAETIKTDCAGASIPVSICYYAYAVSATNPSYTERAMVWKMNEAGQISAPEVYGYLGPKIEDTAESNYVSRAVSVNDAGIAVGSSTYTDSERNLRSTHATVFAESEVSSIVDPQEWDFSSASDINNNNVVVGSANKVINGVQPSKIFVFDYNTKTVTFPKDFFESSSSVPYAINDNNMVVGVAEILPIDSTTRRQVAFLYDMENSTFTDLNTLLPCDSNLNLVEARDINNNNEIIANAVVSVEQRDAKGEVVKDSAGNPLMENVTRSVKLIPVANGTIDNCGVTDDETYEREGGSSGLLSLLLMPLMLLRRRRS